MNFISQVALKWFISVVSSVLLLLIPDAYATIAPEPGHRFPEPYLEYRRAHPEQFEIKGGLRSKVEHARVMRNDAQLQRAMEGTLGTAVPPLASSAEVVSGTIQIPVILVEFNNVAQPYAVGTLQTVLFGANPTGNLTAYYAEVSYGNLNVLGTVSGWFQLPNNDTFYEGTSNGLEPATDQTGQLIQDALNLADTSINFGNFDNDGPDGIPNSGDDDGFVDFIAFVHPEVGGECLGTRLEPNFAIYSFSCGIDADNIVWATEGTTGTARIQFVP